MKNHVFRFTVTVAVLVVASVSYVLWPEKSKPSEHAEQKQPPIATEISPQAGRVQQLGGGTSTLVGLRASSASGVGHTPNEGFRFNAGTRDLSRFPRGLDSHIHQAIENHDGDAALELAEVLNECATIEGDMRMIASRMPGIQDMTLRKAMNKEYMSMQSFSGQCQALRGNLAQVKNQLLDVAVNGGMVGAAAKYYREGSRSEKTLEALARDARIGNLSSLAILAATNNSPSRPEDQNTFRLALVMAAADPQLKPAAAGYLSLAQREYAATKMLAEAKAGTERPEASILDTSSAPPPLPLDSNTKSKEEAQKIVDRLKANKK